jgi:hypothetical protein
VIGDRGILADAGCNQIWVRLEFFGGDAIGDSGIQAAANADQTPASEVLGEEIVAGADTAAHGCPGGQKLFLTEYRMSGKEV